MLHIIKVYIISLKMDVMNLDVTVETQINMLINVVDDNYVCNSNAPCFSNFYLIVISFDGLQSMN